MKKQIASEKAPAAIGPYSQGIEANGFVYCSGQLPIDVGHGHDARGYQGADTCVVGQRQGSAGSRRPDS